MPHHRIYFKHVEKKNIGVKPDLASEHNWTEINMLQVLAILFSSATTKFMQALTNLAIFNPKQLYLSASQSSLWIQVAFFENLNVG